MAKASMRSVPAKILSRSSRCSFLRTSKEGRRVNPMEGDSERMAARSAAAEAMESDMV
jgi:hypothetical protein